MSVVVPPNLAKLSDMAPELGIDPNDSRSRFGRAMRGKPVGTSSEFERIIALPRRRLEIEGIDDAHPMGRRAVFISPNGAREVVPDMTDYFAVNRKKVTLRLWPLQNVALWELYYAGGLFAPITVGGGKTLITCLASSALFGMDRDGKKRSERTVILIKPEIRDQFLRDITFWMKHFVIPVNRIKVWAYSELSVESGATLLENYKPNLIVADEVQCLRIRSSTRTKRVRNYMSKNAETKFAGLTGTAMKNSIHDFAHILYYCLGPKNCPLPVNFNVLEDWAMAIDVPQGDVDRKGPGVLRQFMAPDDVDVRQGIQRRIAETRGVVASSESSIATPIIMSRRQVDMPQVVQQHILEVTETWKIGNDELPDAMHVARVARELTCGFYYEWLWPGGVKDEEWLAVRSTWNSTVGRYLRMNKPGPDSEKLVCKAILKGGMGIWGAEWRNDLDTAYRAWVPIRDDRQKRWGSRDPDKRAVWIDHYLVKDAVKWGREQLRKGKNGIIFYEFQAIGEAIAKLGGWPQFGAGDDATSTNPSKSPIIVGSITTQGTGKNLQAWSNMLVVTPPSSGITWEQMVGRIHRPGQKAPEVAIDVYLHSDVYQRAMRKGFSTANFIELVQGTEQKLNLAILRGIERSTERNDNLDEDLFGEDENETETETEK